MTTDLRLTNEPDGVPRVIVEAAAYRTPDDPLPGRGWSWLVLPGSTPYTRGSEIENAETSAWGRAIGSLGIGIGASVATTDEIESKAGETERDEMRDPTGGLIGTVELRKPPADGELRAGPDGGIIGFGLVGPGGRGRVQVMADDPLASALVSLVKELVGQRVKVYGSVEMVPWKKQGKDMPPYQRLRLSRIEAPEWTLPAPEAVEDDLSDLPEGWGPPVETPA